MKTKALVINSLKYQDKNLIVRCYTQYNGISTYFVRGVYSGNKKNQISAYFLPLTLLEITEKDKSYSGMKYFTDIKLLHPYTSLQNDWYKNTIALFIAEVLSNCLYEDLCEPLLFDFLETALLWFDHHPFYPDFHIKLLLELTKYIGIYPQEYIDETIFTTQDIDVIKHLLNNKLGEKTSLNGAGRKELVKKILKYYQQYSPNFKEIKSLEVVSAILHH